MQTAASVMAAILTAGIFAFFGWYYVSNAKRLADEVYNSARSQKPPWSYLLPTPNVTKESFVFRLRLIGYSAFAGAAAIICITVRNLIHGVQ